MSDFLQLKLAYDEEITINLDNIETLWHEKLKENVGPLTQLYLSVDIRWISGEKTAFKVKKDSLLALISKL